MIFPTFAEEQLLWQQGYTHIAGVDEVGRGAFAGPVVTAAVILPASFPHMDEITDSKLLPAHKRTFLSAVIKEHALSYTISEVCVPCINETGIGEATQKAFQRSILELALQPDFILVDAFFIKGVTPTIQKPIIKGDQKSISIAAASIIAKVYRDALMEALSREYELYDFATNKGYGTKKHRDAITLHGLTIIHRTSFNLQKFL